MTDERFNEIAGRARTIRGAGHVTLETFMRHDIPELIAHARELRAREKERAAAKQAKKEPAKAAV